MFLAIMDLPLIITIVILCISGLLIYLKVNLKICEPNEILIFSGKKRKLKSGEVVGYRFVRGGIGLRTPILERVSRLSLATIPIAIEIEGALSNGMIPLTIVAIAHVKIASKEGEGLENAVERLLGKSSVEIETIARSTIEGTIRGVLATYMPEDANYRRLEVEKDIYAKAKEELANLGFTLDSIKIEDLKDTQGYLEAVGRQRNALVQRDARIKEAESEAEAKIVEAMSRKKASDVEFKSKVAMEEYEVTYRNRKAELNEAAYKLEARADYARKIEALSKDRSIITGKYP
jgi:flotillin